MKRIQKILLATMVLVIGASLFLSSCQDKENVNLADYKSSIHSTTILGTDTVNCDCIINPADTIYTNEIALPPLNIESVQYADDTVPLSTDHNLLNQI